MLQFFLSLLLIQILFFLATWKLYLSAKRKAWEALIPIYSLFVLMQLINRPKWWVILLFIPIISLIVYFVVCVEIIRSFGKNTSKDTCLILVTFGLYIAYVNYSELSYIENRSLEPRTSFGEWVSSILFAIVAATIVHTYFIQPYIIPTSSLEKTLLVGDFLFVSKIHYGARVPITPIAMPMVHDTIPLLNVKSYVFDDDITKKETSILNKFQLPYLRLPGFQKIKRNDIVVFNQPADTLLDMNDFNPDRNYYKPIDKKTNLVKRCVGMPGDSLEIRNGYIYINNKRTKLPRSAKPQYRFFINTEGKQINQSLLKNRYGAREGLSYKNGNFAIHKQGGYVLNLTDNEAAKIAKHPSVNNVTKIISTKGEYGSVFPYISSLGWNVDNFGPIYIPKKGETIKINKQSLPFYKRIIKEYEQNDLIVDGDKISINGKEAINYTFKQDYYWMMGDNRHNSIDARAWGYVPFDHVVGKPVLIWFSWETLNKGFNKIRWERVLSTIGTDGKPKSYLLYFVIVLLTYLIYTKFKKK